MFKSVKDFLWTNFCLQTERCRDRQKDRQTDRQSDSQTDRQKDRQTDRHIVNAVYTHFTLYGVDKIPKKM